jgi:hypothetical protein
MNQEDIKVIEYTNLNTKRFQYWLTFFDCRAGNQTSGKKGKKTLIKYLESLFGPLGQRWHFQRQSEQVYTVKLDQERDLLIFLLKFKSKN